MPDCLFFFEKNDFFSQKSSWGNSRKMTLMYHFHSRNGKINMYNNYKCFKRRLLKMRLGTHMDIKVFIQEISSWFPYYCIFSHKI